MLNEKNYIQLVKELISLKQEKGISQELVDKKEEEINLLADSLNITKDLKLAKKVAEELFSEGEYALKIWAIGLIASHDKKRACEMINVLESTATDMQKLILQGMKNYHKI